MSSQTNAATGTITTTNTSSNSFFSKPEYKIGFNTGNISKVADPVALNGVLNAHYTDLSVPIVGGSIEFTRSYNTRTVDRLSLIHIYTAT